MPYAPNIDIRDSVDFKEVRRGARARDTLEESESG
jgi:hypothetical protein